MQPWSRPSRRHFLRALAGVAALPVLAACGGTTPPPPASATGSSTAATGISAAS